MRISAVYLYVASCLWAGSAAASVPTVDAAQLTQHARTSSSTVRLVPIEGRRKDADQGVHCSVTTGKKASVADPAVRPQDGAGTRMIRSYAPDRPAMPIAGTRGAALNSQTLFKTAGDVAAGLDAGHATTVAALSAFQTASRQVGTATTVMAALDMNSASRLQNGITWNGVIGSANLWVQALNALNLAAASDASRAAAAMRTTVTGPPNTVAAWCPVGLVGSGTAVDQCRSPACTGSSPAAVTCLGSSVTNGRGMLVPVVAPPGAPAAERAVASQVPQPSAR